MQQYAHLVSTIFLQFDTHVKNVRHTSFHWDPLTCPNFGRYQSDKTETCIANIIDNGRSTILVRKVPHWRWLVSVEQYFGPSTESTFWNDYRSNGNRCYSGFLCEGIFQFTLDLYDMLLFATELKVFGDFFSLQLWTHLQWLQWHICEITLLLLWHKK